MQKFKPTYTNIFYAILCLFFLGWLQACSSSEHPNDFNRVAGLKSSSAPGINSIRLTGLKQIARGLGAQAGLSWRTKQINSILLQQRKKLDRIFNFNFLTLDHNVLPPVLAEGRNTLNVSDAYTIRVSDRNYQIIFPPRFVTTPPTWRDYIWLHYKKPEAPNASLLPKNNNEKKVWNEYISIGWNEGVSQANEIFSANLGRLQRDYLGMILYRKLLAQNMVTAPYVSQADLGVTGGGSEMNINDRVLRITAISELKSNSKDWKPAMVEKSGDGMPKIVLSKAKKEKI
jgi:defect-in-organelle-trafficking protein DotC